MKRFNPRVQLTNPGVTRAGLFLLCLLIVCLNTSAGRPLWIDEFLHFAFAGFPTTNEAWNAIRASIKEVNHGQTGIYFIIDYWLLKVFGANLFWLRFPSIVSGLATFAATQYIFQLWKLPTTWQLLGILALAAQSTLMSFIGEARPYMPLVAATIGTLAYYSTPDSDRRRLNVLSIGILSILTGVLFHPYFCVYWFSIYIFTYVQNLIEKSEKPSILSLIHHSNLPLSIVGIGIYLVLARTTWMQGRPDFSTGGLNPFEHIKQEALISTFLQLAHLQFISSPLIIGNILTTAFLLSTIVCFFISLSVTIKGFRLSSSSLSVQELSQRELLPPVLLLFLAFGISAFLSFVSFQSSYWILSRQWVASIAISALASILFAYRLTIVLGRYNQTFKRIWIACLILPLLVSFYESTRSSTVAISQRFGAAHFCSQSRTENGPLMTPRNNDEWVELANRNICQGGPVWPQLQNYYAKYIDR